jgi:hypothetical protein
MNTIISVISGIVAWVISVVLIQMSGSDKLMQSRIGIQLFVAFITYKIVKSLLEKNSEDSNEDEKKVEDDSNKESI